EEEEEEEERDEVEDSREDEATNSFTETFSSSLSTSTSTSSSASTFGSSCGAGSRESIVLKAAEPTWKGRRRVDQVPATVPPATPGILSPGMSPERRKLTLTVSPRRRLDATSAKPANRTGGEESSDESMTLISDSEKWAKRGPNESDEHVKLSKRQPEVGLHSAKVKIGTSSQNRASGDRRVDEAKSEHKDRAIFAKNDNRQKRLADEYEEKEEEEEEESEEEEDEDDDKEDESDEENSESDEEDEEYDEYNDNDGSDVYDSEEEVTPQMSVSKRAD
ncbi:unnamed protein product, partial [Protopolystoma xenopodis]